MLLWTDEEIREAEKLLTPWRSRLIWILFPAWALLWVLFSIMVGAVEVAIMVMTESDRKKTAKPE